MSKSNNPLNDPKNRSAETLLVHAELADKWVPQVLDRLSSAGVEVRGDARVRALWPNAKDYLINLSNSANGAVLDMIMPGMLTEEELAQVDDVIEIPVYGLPLLTVAMLG